MSIAPPSDIVLDVAQAADPARREAAVARLAAAAGGAGGADFSASLGGTAAAAPSQGLPAKPDATAGGIGTWGAAQHASRPLSPYQKFEAVLLQTAFQDILPKDDELFGDAASADACRSMLAEQLANRMAASGSFGVAKAIEKHAAAHATAGADGAASLAASRGPGGFAAGQAAAPRAPAPIARATPGGRA